MYSFKKEERLCNKKLIERLFHNGSSFLLYPFRIVWMRETLPVNSSAQVLISVPKKKFKRAVDRNLLKRRIREIYRLNKAESISGFLSENSTSIIFSITYIGNNIADYQLMEKKFLLAMSKLRKELGNHVE